MKEKKARQDGLSTRTRGEQRKESSGKRDGGGTSGKQKWEEGERETMARVGEERWGWVEGRGG